MTWVPSHSGHIVTSIQLSAEHSALMGPPQMPLSLQSHRKGLDS